MDLDAKAKWVRRQILEMVAHSGKGHLGGSFSCAEILVALYYGGVLRFDAQNPNWEDRDRFILSKGHAAIALYSILADVGYFDKSLLETYCQEDSLLEGHPNKELEGIEHGTGSLGHGLGIATGLALAAKMDSKDWLTFVLLSEGDCYEGSTWEAAMFASHHRLDNLIAIVDRNKQCVLDFTERNNKLEPFALKWEAFGWDVLTVDGHSFELLIPTLMFAKKNNAPTVIIADTIKGKGVSFMEKKLEWHNKLPNKEELELARQELE